MTADPDNLLAPEFLARLERLELNVRRLRSGDRRGEVPANRKGPGTLFRGHRSYAPGDDPRFLDWNAFLRLDELLVKEFDAEETPRVTVFLDASASMGTSQRSKFDAGRRLAAALGFIALARHGAVRVVPVPGEGRGGETWVGRGRLRGYLTDIGRLLPRGAADALRSFQAAAPPGRRAGLALVISDFYETGDFRLGLQFLRKRGYQVEALHLFDPTEIAPRLAGMVELVDVESGRRRRELMRPELIEAFRRVVDAHFAEVMAACRSIGAGYHRLDVTESMEHLVLAVLRGRAVVE